MVHYYRDKKIHRTYGWQAEGKKDQFRLLCNVTKWTDAQPGEEYRTALGQITCPDCLDILIPKELKTIRTMLKHRHPNTPELETHQYFPGLGSVSVAIVSGQKRISWSSIDGSPNTSPEETPAPQEPEGQILQFPQSSEPEPQSP
jgi:hypothetical protein